MGMFTGTAGDDLIDAADGNVDIVIGTHKLLNEDIRLSTSVLKSITPLRTTSIIFSRPPISSCNSSMDGTGSNFALKLNSVNVPSGWRRPGTFTW